MSQGRSRTAWPQFPVCCYKVWLAAIFGSAPEWLQTAPSPKDYIKPWMIGKLTQAPNPKAHSRVIHSIELYEKWSTIRKKPIDLVAGEQERSNHEHAVITLVTKDNDLFENHVLCTCFSAPWSEAKRHQSTISIKSKLGLLTKLRYELTPRCRGDICGKLAAKTLKMRFHRRLTSCLPPSNILALTLEHSSCRKENRGAFVMSTSGLAKPNSFKSLLNFCIRRYQKMRQTEYQEFSEGK